jgi:hypothetical protein
VDTSSTGVINFRLSRAIQAGWDTSGVIENCDIGYAQECICLVATDAVTAGKHVAIRNNTIHHNRDGVLGLGAPMEVVGNYISFDYNASTGCLRQRGGSWANIEGNHFHSVIPIGIAIFHQQVWTLQIRNNLITNVAPYDDAFLAVEINRLVPGFPTTGAIVNNTIDGPDVGIDSYGGSITIRNNIIQNTVIGSLVYDTAQTGAGQVGFNLYWNNFEGQLDPDTAQRLAEGSRFACPMFMGPGDYRLQAHSPAIDAGDTLLLDPDGSRSDMGWLGGPAGTSYSYQDLPPQDPNGLGATYQDSGVHLTWRANCEADLASYELYRSRAPIVSANASDLLANIVANTAFADTSVQADSTYYYRLRARDTDGDSSGLSNEVYVVTTGVDPSPSLPDRIELLPAYPNPFNGGIKVRVLLSSTQPREVFDVQLNVFDLLGRSVAVLYRGPMPLGEREFAWSGRNHGGLRMPSGRYFVRLKVGHQVRSTGLTLLR